MKELYKKYKSKGLQIAGVSTDKDRNKWTQALDKLQMPYLQLWDKNGNTSRSYFVRGIPYVLLINPKGVIVGIERGEELEKLLEKTLN